MVKNNFVLKEDLLHIKNGLIDESFIHENLIKEFQKIRELILPKNNFDAPSRGSTVTLYTNQRTHAKTIDAGSGYLCQMEPVAHYGIRSGENIEKIVVTWTDGTTKEIYNVKLNQMIEIKQDYAF